MNMPSASPADTPAEATRRVLVWDAPVRLFHWLMVACFAGAWLTAESERFRLLHVTLGLTMVGLVVFRLLWGLVGTKHARFASFVRGPAAAWQHLKAMFAGRHEGGAGHNPAGALAIVAMLGVTLAVGASGWLAYGGNDMAGEVHEGVATGLLALVGLHLAGVALASWLGRRNLVKPMLTGRTEARAEEGIRSARVGIAAALLTAVLGFWAWQWQATPVAPVAAAGERVAGHHGHGDRHQDHGD